MHLNSFKANAFSQNGEDGIIEEILRRLSPVLPDQLSCVEFGAWDGVYLSNTFNLVTKGAKALYIEGDEARFSELLVTCSKYPNITPHKAFVGTDPPHDLSSILSLFDIAYDFDVLSIDVDSIDLSIWSTLVTHKPKIVIIEINSTINPIIPHTHNSFLPGNSFFSTLAVATSLGYHIVSHTGNLIFVSSDYMHLVKLPFKYIVNPLLLFDFRWQPSRLSFIRSRLASVRRRILSR